MTTPAPPLDPAAALALIATALDLSEHWGPTMADHLQRVIANSLEAAPADNPLPAITETLENLDSDDPRFLLYNATDSADNEHRGPHSFTALSLMIRGGLDVDDYQLGILSYKHPLALAARAKRQTS